MILFDGPFFQVRQGFFSGWKVLDRMSGATSIPSSLFKERIGLVWMQVRRTKKHLSIDSGMSEEVMFGSFAKAVADPSGDEGQAWMQNSPDTLADLFIAKGNGYIKTAAKGLPR